MLRKIIATLAVAIIFGCNGGTTFPPLPEGISSTGMSNQTPVTTKPGSQPSPVIVRKAEKTYTLQEFEKEIREIKDLIAKKGYPPPERISSPSLDGTWVGTSKDFGTMYAWIERVPGTSFYAMQFTSRLNSGETFSFWPDKNGLLQEAPYIAEKWCNVCRNIRLLDDGSIEFQYTAASYKVLFKRGPIPQGAAHMGSWSVAIQNLIENLGRV